MIGAVSSHPGYVGNDIYDPTHPENTALVGLLGQIPVQVSAANGPIEPGDMLTMSAVPGVAEKATSAGTVLGSALEGYSGSATGLINVYVHVGYYAPPVSDTAQPTGTMYLQNDDDASFASLNVTGQTTIASLNVTGSATISGQLTVGSLTVNSDLTVNGHVVSGGAAPSISSSTGCATSETVSGTDTAGLITITRGASCTSTNLGTVTFAKPFNAPPRVTLTPANMEAAASEFYVDSSQVTSSGFGINTVSTPTPGKTYEWYYQVIQ